MNTTPSIVPLMLKLDTRLLSDFLNLISYEEFEEWLFRKNSELSNRTPAEIILDGRPQVVEDFIRDIITGSPK